LAHVYAQELRLAACDVCASNHDITGEIVEIL